MSDNSDRIKIDFPHKMEVHSPEITSLNKIAERISNWLHTDLKEIIKSLQVLYSLPEIIKDFKLNIVKQFSQLSTNMLESDLINRQASVQCFSKKIALTENHIEKKQIHMTNSVESIKERYDKFLSNISQEHEIYLKSIDSHAYELIDKVYPDDIQLRFSSKALPNLNKMLNHNSKTAILRTLSLNDNYLNVVSEIENFIESRKNFYSELEEFSLHTPIEEGNYCLPFGFVKVKNIETNKETIKQFFNFDTVDETQLPDFVRTSINSIIDDQPSDDDVINQEVYEYLKSRDDIIESELKRFVSNCYIKGVKEN